MTRYSYLFFNHPLHKLIVIGFVISHVWQVLICDEHRAGVDIHLWHLNRLTFICVHIMTEKKVLAQISVIHKWCCKCREWSPTHPGILWIFELVQSPGTTSTQPSFDSFTNSSPEFFNSAKSTLVISFNYTKKNCRQIFLESLFLDNKITIKSAQKHF